MILQEKHTNGHLWWKITYYKYFKYSPEIAAMLQIRIIPAETVEAVERGK